MSGNSAERIYYWDSCIYIAWMKAEVCHGAVALDAMTRIAEDCERGRCRIITSALIHTEVLQSKVSSDIYRKFCGAFGRYHQCYDVDSPTSRRAGALREIVWPGDRTLGTADAIHLATALLRKADEFWTFDEGKKGRDAGLLELQGCQAIRPLRVTRPSLSEPEFPGLVVPASPKV
jgi:predicted nucleic acid-binding protein